MVRRATRMPGVPSPYPDELLYSVLARSVRYLCVTSPKQLGALLLGSRNALAIPDLPSRLSALGVWAQAEWHLSLDEIALKHTAAPYFTHLRGRPQYRQTVRAMSGTGRSLQVRLGLCTSIVQDTGCFRLCTRCVEEDLASWGETYWRRTHQLPGVLVCPTHGTPLHVTSIAYRSPQRQNFIAATPALAATAVAPTLSADSTALALKLAIRSRELCESVPPRARTLLDYRPALAQLGFRGGRGDTARWVTAMSEFIGEELRPLLFKGSSMAWAAMAARKPRRLLHPVQHLLIGLFVDHHSGEASSTTSEIATPTRWKTRDAGLRREAAQLHAIGYRPSAIARTLGVAWQTASRLIAPLEPLPVSTVPDTSSARDRWLEVALRNPTLTRSKVRKLVPADYAMLYRWDREWLMQHGPAAQKPVRRTARVDWAHRDGELTAVIRDEASRLLALDPPVRVTAHRVLGRLGRRAQVAHFGDKLPLALSALTECCESVEGFQIRRVAGILNRAGQHGAEWEVLREARINPARFADGGRGLLAQGRRLGGLGAVT